MAHVEVSRVIDAAPARIYELVSDLPRMGEWSPENTGGKWLDGVTEARVGARFRGNNRKGPMRWQTLVTVVTADAGEEFAFDVTSLGQKVARWGYRLSPVARGTEVVEYWDDHRSGWMARFTGIVLRIPDRAAHNRAGMETTLDRLAAAAES
jgi:uncharacterized protein YndB with AHSA1/START domain